MAWTLISHTGAQSANQGNATTGNINTTGADLIVVVASWYQGIIADIAISDVPGVGTPNTWTYRTEYSSTNRRVQIVYVQNPTTAATHAFIIQGSSGGAIYPTICVSAWSGSVTSPYESENGANTGSATSLATGGASPTTTDLFIAGLSQGGFEDGVPTVGGSFTVTDAFSGVTNFAVEGGMAYFTSSSSQSATWNFASNEAAVAIAAFKGPGGGGGGAIQIPSFRSNFNPTQRSNTW